MQPAPADPAVRAAAAAVRRWATPAAASCGSSACTARSARAILLGRRAAARPAGRSTSRSRNAFITGTGLYFVFGLSSFWWVQQDRAAAAAADDAVQPARRRRVLPVARDVRRRHASARRCRSCCSRSSRPAGWILRTQTAFFHAAFAAIALLGLDVYRACCRARSAAPQVFQTGLIGFGYFATVGIAVALGRYTKQSEDLAAQRGIDVANLEQVNRLIIQDMQDGVLVVDLNGVVRGHNAQVTRLLGGFGRMRGGMRLAEFSHDAARLLAALAGGLHRGAAAVQGRGDAAAAARAPRAHRLGPERRHAHLSRGPRPRADRGAADEARGDGPAHRVDRARGAQSAVGDQPGGAAARGGRRRRARGRAPARR